MQVLSMLGFEFDDTVGHWWYLSVNAAEGVPTVIRVNVTSSKRPVVLIEQNYGPHLGGVSGIRLEPERIDRFVPEIVKAFGGKSDADWRWILVKDTEGVS